MEVTTIGIDLAKSVLAVSCADGRGKLVVRKQLRRAQVLEFNPREFTYKKSGGRNARRAVCVFHDTEHVSLPPLLKSASFPAGIVTSRTMGPRSLPG